MKELPQISVLNYWEVYGAVHNFVLKFHGWLCIIWIGAFNNIKEGDYIELGQLGAYGLTFRTKFNGFYSNEIYEVEDSPIMSLYDKDINKATLVA